MKKSDVALGEHVEGGRPYSEDFDQGRIIGFSRDYVEVAWQSGTSTRQSASTLRLGWSERWLSRD